MKTREKIPTEFLAIDASASLIAKEKFMIYRQTNKHFLLSKDKEVYMVGFGYGPKTEDHKSGFYCYWVWYQAKEPYGGIVNCELKNKYDAIDYYETCRQNAEETISAVLNPAE